MKRTFINHGNAFDKKYYSFTKAFPQYEIFWSTYVGCTTDNEFDSSELPINGINDEYDTLRKKIWQWTYTSFVNYIHLVELNTDISKYSIDNFTKLERLYLLSTHLYYNTIECIEKIQLSIRPKTNRVIGIPFFKKLRDIIAHNCRPLIMISHDNLYRVISTKQLNFVENNFESRNSTPIWTEGFNIPKNIEFVGLDEYISELCKSIVDIFNYILNLQLSKFKKMNIPELPDPREPGVYIDNIGRPLPSASIYDFR